MQDNKRGHMPCERSLVRLGMSVVHSLGVCMRVVTAIVKGIVGMLWYMLCQIGRLFCFLLRLLHDSFQEHTQAQNAMLLAIKRERREEQRIPVAKIVQLFAISIFGEHGLLRTGFNYLLPVVSIVFLFGLVRYGTGLEYAISVSVNGEELGLIYSEEEFTQAEAEVKQRVGSSDGESEFTPSFTLKIVSDEDTYVDVQTLANKLLAGSTHMLVDAYGVYVDGNFIGAVTEEDKSEIATTMDATLAIYAASLSDMVNEVYYTKQITYQYGVYLEESLSTADSLLAILESSEETQSYYVTTSSDTLMLVAEKYNMTEDEIIALNPKAKRSFTAGMLLTVVVYERYIPIAYTKNMVVVSYIDYDTIEVETSALNLGVVQTLSKGVVGERTSEVLVTYINDVESSTTVLSSVITKEPVAEQVGIGTYSPQPASTSTVISGNGMFGWPVNGGYISDTYISNRNHKGIDIAASYGTEIYAAGDGTVIASGWNSGGYGYYVMIEHENGYVTLYGHCSVLVAVEGQEVEKGQLIAYVGSTGNSTGNHCHFEVRLNGICTNPCDYLRVNAD